MKINLTQGYFITQDNYNYILNRHLKYTKKDKTEGERDEVVGFFGHSMKQCIRYFLRCISMTEEECDFLTYVSLAEEKMEQATEQICRAWETANGRE